jgi:hypothetical protein
VVLHGIEGKGEVWACTNTRENCRKKFATEIEYPGMYLLHPKSRAPDMDHYLYRGCVINWRPYLPSVHSTQMTGMWSAVYLDQPSELLYTYAVLESDNVSLGQAERRKAKAFNAMIRLIDNWFEGKVETPKDDYTSQVYDVVTGEY